MTEKKDEAAQKTAKKSTAKKTAAPKNTTKKSAPSKPKAIDVGIDLGTSRSAITTSGGERHVVESFVGWPVDMVARKVLGSDVLVGAGALEARTMLDLHRPLEQGLIKEGSERDLQAVRELFAHLLELGGVPAGDERPEVRAVVGVPAEAMQVNRQQLRRSLGGLVDALMIVSEPFAVAYGQEALLYRLIVDVGAGTTDLCLMLGHLPTEDDQRTLLAAGDSIDRHLQQAIAQHHPGAQFSIHMVREWKEAHAFIGEPQAKVEVTVPFAGKPTQIDITHDMRTACESIVGPIAEAVLDLLPRVEPEYQERVRHGILLSGGSSQIPGLRAALQAALDDVGGGEVGQIEDPVFAGSNGALAIALDAQESDWEKIS